MNNLNHSYSFWAIDEALPASEIARKFDAMPRDDTVRIHINDEAHEVVIDFLTPKTHSFKSSVHIWLDKFMQRVDAEHSSTEQYGLCKCIDGGFDVISTVPTK